MFTMIILITQITASNLFYTDPPRPSQGDSYSGDAEQLFENEIDDVEAIIEVPSFVNDVG